MIIARCVDVERFQLEKSTPKIVENGNYKNYNILSVFKDHLARLFSQCDWEVYDLNILLEKFKAAFIQTAEKHALIRLRKVRSD